MLLSIWIKAFLHENSTILSLMIVLIDLLIVKKLLSAWSKCRVFRATRSWLCSKVTAAIVNFLRNLFCWNPRKQLNESACKLRELIFAFDTYIDI